MTTAVRVAIPSPLRRSFDYVAPDESGIEPGSRVCVPFGRRTVVGVVVENKVTPSVDESRLKAVTSILDDKPLLDAHLLGLLRFCSQYYHHPIGDVAQTMLPLSLRNPRPAVVKGVTRFRVTPAGSELDIDALTRAPRQRAALRVLRDAAPGSLTRAELESLSPGTGNALRPLQSNGWVETQIEEPALLPPLPGREPHDLSAEQLAAVDAVAEHSDEFSTYLLDGVTGSGKTEVYLSLTSAMLERGKQVLVLVPEIGLTPQIVERFRQHLNVPLVVAHSGLADGARAGAWLAARDGRGAVILGTRSAVFTPAPNLGLIIVDEEHDMSYKQQEGLRYSARDLALVRAQTAKIPVLLGSATPSLESLANVARGRFIRLPLTARAAGASPPTLKVVDLRGQYLRGNLSPAVLAAVRDTLARDEQVLLFVNRRGFAPALLCHECGFVHGCSRCDAKLVLHRASNRLRCHHCGRDERVPRSCSECESETLTPVGIGTERLEDELREAFPDTPLARIDRDTTRRRGELESQLEEARAGNTRILIGTQMLAKGHHFPGVTLVAIVDADGGLFSSDFRATERMAQLIVQVAGRAGRESRAGQVLIQTHQPDHPLLVALLTGSYGDFARAALVEREMALLPPTTALALLRAEGPSLGLALDFLDRASHMLRQLTGAAQLEILGPIPAPMERRQGRYRAQLLISGGDRRALRVGLNGWAAALEAEPSARKVRWSLDIDPQDMS
jgi:primosomal protein N' (replication factor Y) (superfamily II helicase)